MVLHHWLVAVLCCLVVRQSLAASSVFEWTLTHAPSGQSRDSSSGTEFGVSCLASLLDSDAATHSLTGAHAALAVTACKPLRRAGASGRWSVLSDPEESWPMPNEDPILIKHGPKFANSELLVSPGDKMESRGLDMYVGFTCPSLFNRPQHRLVFAGRKAS